MKFFILILLSICLANSVLAQDYLEIRKHIVPLQSSRSDVEKIAQFVKDYHGWIEYETDNEFIHVVYSKGNCQNNDWNVSFDKVLYYWSYPKKKIDFGDLSEDVKNFPYNVDDIGHKYFIDSTKGIRYVIEYPTKEIYEIIFIPTINDANLRCETSPIYEPISENYTHDTLTIKKLSEWNVGSLLEVFSSIKQLNLVNGYVFVYCKKGQKKVCDKIISDVEYLSKKELKNDAARLKVSFGGYREENQVESFLLHKDQQPPVPRPSVSGVKP